LPSGLKSKSRRALDTISGMKENDDQLIPLNPIEIEMLKAALDCYETKVRKKRSDSIIDAIRAVKQKLTIASQGTDNGDR
jgi:hypothetical protein